MTKYKAFLFLILLFLACKAPKNDSIGISANTKPSKGYQEQIENMEQRIYFRAMGNEPEWSLQIAANKISFTSLKSNFESFNAPHVDPIRAMDANVKSYRVVTETGTMVITIEQQKCTNAMSGEIFPYTVRVEIEKSKDKSIASFQGCGNYIVDPRLHDIWVLEKMNGKNVSSSEFVNELPYLEINSNSGTFMGYAGCNRMNGSLFFEKEVLRFTSIITTRMACISENKEGEFLHSLESTTSYEVANMRLTLTNPSGIELIFKKVD